MLILDLDDTLFATQSMDDGLFETAISLLTEHISDEGLNLDLWTMPFDWVITKYNISANLVSAFYNEIKKISSSDLCIETYGDYSALHAHPISKILVTTGMAELQYAKIEALNIALDFKSIMIDDPRTRPRTHKIDLFKNILVSTNCDPKEIWVIGDNPESEIRAGKMLGMNTIQRKSESKSTSDYADFVIESFTELNSIIPEFSNGK